MCSNILENILTLSNDFSDMYTAFGEHFFVKILLHYTQRGERIISLRRFILCQHNYAISRTMHCKWKEKSLPNNLALINLIGISWISVGALRTTYYYMLHLCNMDVTKLIEYMIHHMYNDIHEYNNLTFHVLSLLSFSSSRFHKLLWSMLTAPAVMALVWQLRQADHQRLNFPLETLVYIMC